MEDISENERKALVVFRKRVEDVLPNEYTKSDDYLIRWLRARDSNQRLAEELLRKNFLWRTEHDLNHILELPADPFFVENFACHVDGVAMNGGPVLCASMRDWDIRKLVSNDRIKQLQSHMNFQYETLEVKIQRYNEGRRPGEKATGFTVIVNWEGFSIFHLTSIKGIQALLNGFSTMEAHYPETMAKAIFINTSYVFQTFFVMAKPLLAPKTLSKFTFYGTNRAEWEPAVRGLVEANQIPYEFGGMDR